MEIMTAKLELYPADAPVGYMVGFSVTTDGGRNFYHQQVISLSDVVNMTDEEIVAAAYGQQRLGIDLLAASVDSRPPVVGQPFVPEA